MVDSTKVGCLLNCQLIADSTADYFQCLPQPYSPDWIQTSQTPGPSLDACHQPDEANAPRRAGIRAAFRCGVTLRGHIGQATEVSIGHKRSHTAKPTLTNHKLTTMQAVVFKGKLQVALETRPRPQIQDPKDAIVKVRYSALCGR
jgi:hypothetical protein